MKHPDGSLVALVVGALFLIIGCVGFVGSWAAYQLDTGIVKHGQRAQGHIISKGFLFVADGDSEYNVKYWFKLEGGPRVDASRGVDEALWRTLREGESFVVVYSAENPRRNFPLSGGVTSFGVAVWLSILFLVFAGFGVLMITGFSLSRRTYV
jgi:Protein of unknown function (DUF3592)